MQGRDYYQCLLLLLGVAGPSRAAGTGGMLFNNNFERAAKPVDGDVIAKKQQKRDLLLRCHLLVT